MLRLLPLLLALGSASTALADKTPTSIESVSLRIFNGSTGQIVALKDAPRDGAVIGNELLAVVKVVGDPGTLAKPLELVVRLTAPAVDKHLAWHPAAIDETHSESVTGIRVRGENDKAIGASFFLFRFAYPCNAKANVKATLSNGKTLTADMNIPCDCDE